MNTPDSTPPTAGATIADFEAVRIAETGELAWLFTGEHRPCAPDAPTCNAPGCCGEGVWS